MIRIILFLLLMIAHHEVSASSSTTKRLINSSNGNSNTEAEYPRALSLKQFSSVLKFDRYERFEERNNLGTLLASSDEIWESKVSSFWIGAREMQKNSTNLHKEGSSSSSKSVENEAQQLHPFLLCHLDKTSTSGRQRYKIIKKEITKKENDSNVDFFMNELPVYNHNFDVDEYKSQKLQQEHNVEKESDEEEIPYGACFYGSMSYLVAKDLKGSNTFVTPMFSDLKIRRGASLMSNGENTDHERTIAVSVQLSPGIATSQQQVMELAYTLLEIEKNISKDSSSPICIESFQLLTSMSVTVSSIDISSFTYEVEKSKSQQNIISNECVMYFIEYLAKQPQVLSVSPVSQTIMLNDIASWIIQGYPEENDSRPWFEAGIRGEGEIVQLLDSGIDESSCYLKDASGEVPLTTDYDLTGGKIDLSKRKIVQYVALNAFNGDRADGTSHGTHVAATIAGKRSDDGVTEIDGMVDGISPGVKIAFFDAHNDPTGNDNTFAIPLDIQFLFYFGRKVGARIHSASWGEHVNGEYSERIRLTDSYFYDDTEDNFVMFAAAGNSGLEGSSTVLDPSLAKNVISVGASHSNGTDLSNNMLGMDHIAAFSGRGPTADGRIKPDIVAPGHSILSAAANTGKCDPGVPPKYDPDNKEHAGLMFMSGTSMSCPVAVGAGALVRQYFREVYDPSIDISGTLLKAVLVNGAEALVGRSKYIDGTDFDISTQYDEFQGFGRVNLMNSLKHPDIDTPDVHVEDTRVLQQGQTHKYEFNVCDDREFRITIAWKDPPGQVGCAKCLVNDLNLEVLYDGQTYYPNGRTNRDRRNNVERVILSRDDFSSSNFNSVIVKVKAENLGYGTLQKYSLASTGCFDSNEVELIGSDSGFKCEDDEFEYTIDIFTNRKPEETSWILKKQGNDEVIAAVTAGEYEEDVDRLKSFRYKGCITNGCYIFIIKDTGFDGLCCEKGMGSYSIGADDEVLIESDSFVDRQKIEKFCYLGSFTEDPTASPTVVCKDDEFKYQIDIDTDLYPDETRWILLKKPHIDGVDEGNYTESYREYIHEGCLDLGGCYSFSAYGNGEYTIKANEFIVADRESFYPGKYEEFCYSEESNNPTSSYGIRTATVGGNKGEKFDDMHPLWKYGKIVQIELYSDGYLSYYVRFIGITYEDGQSFEHGGKSGNQHIINLGEDQYITKVSGRSGNYYIYQLVFETNNGEVFGPYGFSGSSLYTPFEFDFGGKVLVYIFGRSDDDDYNFSQLGFAHASLPQTTTDSPTAQPTSLPCGDNQYRYEIIVRTDKYPEDIWWELYQVVDSVLFMTYRNQLESYSHTGCTRYDENYEFLMIDRRQDGLCCYFGSGSYKLSVGDDVVVQGNHFDDAISVGKWDMDLDFVYNKHEFSYDRQPSEAPPSFAVQPTSNPSEMTCSEDEFEYRIRVRTNMYPLGTSWSLKYLNGDIIENVEEGEYFLEHYEHNHRGCLPLNGCFEFYISSCCDSGNGGYTIFANDVVMAEGGEFNSEERKTICYGPSVTNYPSSLPTSDPLLCNENKFKYEVVVTTDYYPWLTSWELSYDDGTIIASVEEGYYTQFNTEHVHKACINLDSCVTFTIFDDWGGLCCGGGYTIKVDDVVMAEGGEFNYEETKTVCYGPSYSFSPSSSPTIPLVCDGNEFKYEVIVTIDVYAYETSWELNYTNGTIIDSVEEREYTERNTEHVHKGCLDLDSCVIFTVFDSYGDGIHHPGGYTIFADDDVMAEGGGDYDYWYEQKHEFCYGPSYSFSPSSSDVCENGSKNHEWCGYWASIGLCEDNNVQNWMQENCAKACSNCCLDYLEWCDDYAFSGRCTDTSFWWNGFTTWEEYMQATCRYSCDTCDLDFTPSSTTPPVTCNDDQFKYEIIVTNDDYYYYYLECGLYYKYPDLIDGYVDGLLGYFPPNFKKRFYGCAKYSCFDLNVWKAYVKMYDKDKDILIAQNTEKREDLRICHYAPEPTTSPTVSLSPSYPFAEAIFTISLEFSTSPSNYEDISKLVQRSVLKILFHAQIENENIVTIILDSSCEEESKICDFSFQICEGPCGEGEEPDFLAFVGNTMKEVEANGQLLQTIIATADHMDAGTVDSLTQVHPILYDFEYDAWPTTSPTTLPSSTPTQDCDAPAFVQNLFGFITNIFKPITQAITNTADPISDILFGVESYSSTAITTCKDKMFQLQLEIKTDGSPEKTSWELLYENGTIIESIGRDTYSEFDTVYNHSYCLDTSCFVFNLFDSFEFKGSYNITVGDTVLAQQDSFLWWKESKQFCYPQCDNDGMFALQIDVVTDPWPHETSWQLAFANGTLVDSVDEGYYTGLNTSYSHRYCLQEGCYSVTFHDHIGDGMCCSYGDGSYMIKINDDEIAVKQGGKFEESESTTFCYPFDDVSCKGCEDNEKSLFEKITHHILSKQREV